MSRASQTSLHREERRYVPKLRRALLKAAERAREGVSLMKLANALEKKDIGKALAAVGEEAIEEKYVPMTGIVRDAFEKGGKVAGRFVRG